MQYNASHVALVVKHSRAALVTTVSASSAPQILLWKRVHCSGCRSGHLSGALAWQVPLWRSLEASLQCFTYKRALKWVLVALLK